MTALALPFPDISPELFAIEVFGFEFALRWYALAYIAGIILGWRILVHMTRRPKLWPGDKSAVTAAQAEDLMTWVILGIILGGRLGFVLFYQPAFYLSNPVEILKVWQGGMAFHGGALGVLIAAFIWCQRNGVSKLTLGDAVCAVVPPGIFLGRLANFINAELWGRETSAPWGVIFPGEAAQNCADFAAGICARHPSQLYEAALEGLLLGAALLWLVYRRQALKRPGLLIGVFFAGYGCARFLVEFFRQPDAQFISEGNPLGWVLHAGGIGLTMGQLLSLPMIAVGLYFALTSRRRA